LPIHYIVNTGTILVSACPHAENRAVKDVQEVRTKLDTYPLADVRAFDNGNHCCPVVEVTDFGNAFIAIN